MITSDKNSFEALNLPPYIVESLFHSGYNAPTPVQEQAIPVVLQGEDLWVQAQTGTGKTAAFALPLIVRLNQQPPKPFEIDTLVLAPTRELVLQVSSFFQRYGKRSPQPVKIVSIIGGIPYSAQLDAMVVGPSIAIATPGRLIDMAERGDIHLSTVRTLVIDEADKLLNLGFSDELEAILSQLPSRRQTLLFSATFPAKVSALAEKVLVDPKRIVINGDSPTVATVTQRVIEVPAEQRRMLLAHLIQTEKWRHVLVFVASKRAAANLAAKLTKMGIRSAAFHGDLTQEERIAVLDRFKSKKIHLLTATDIAARGIDFSQVSHVVNYDLPRSTTDYVHRIGRTGRAGTSGVAVSFKDHESRAHFDLIEKRAQIHLAAESIPGFELRGQDAQQVKGPAPQKGKRKSKKDRLREASKNDNGNWG